MTHPAEEALAELARRHSAKARILALSDGFPQQREFILDPSRRLAGRATRRSAKSYSAALKMLYCGYEHPGCDIIYVMHSRDQARSVMFRQILGKIDEELKLGLDFNKQLLEITFPNGSIIRMLGLDKDDQQANKVLGNKLKMVVIDEAAFYTQDLAYMIEEVFSPALMDARGQLILISSANPQRTNGIFYDITERPETDPKYMPGYKVYRWKWQDNPFARDAVKESIDEIIKGNPNYSNTRTYKVQWEDIWIPDDSILVYKYTQALNDAEALPRHLDFKYIISTDLGFSPDPTAIMVGAWAENHPVLYLVESIVLPKADLTTVATMLKKVQAFYKPVKMIVDAAAKQSVEEMKRRHGLPLYPAKKWGITGVQAKVKSDFIEMMNNDMLCGRVKVLPNARGVISEWEMVPWDAKELELGNRVEAPGRHQDQADNALYIWKECLNWLTAIDVPNPTPASREEKIEAEILAGLTASQGSKKSFWERDFPRSGRVSRARFDD